MGLLLLKRGDFLEFGTSLYKSHDNDTSPVVLCMMVAYRVCFTLRVVLAWCPVIDCLRKSYGITLAFEFVQVGMGALDMNLMGKVPCMVRMAKALRHDSIT